MAYIGQDIEGGVLEKQTLAFDSVTTTFELDYYSAENGLVVSVGGIIQEPGVAFTVNGKNIVFASAPTQATFVVFIERELTIGTVKALDYIQYQSGSGNGTTTPVTLNNSVTNPEEIMVSLNGLTQIPTTDYTVSGTTLTFDEAPVAGTEIFILFLRLGTTEGVLPSGYTLTDSKIVSLDAGKLTGFLPGAMTTDMTPQWHALNSVGMHWMNLENKTKMNLVQSYYDHFEDDTGWLPYNGESGFSAAGTLEDHSPSSHTLNMGNGGPALVGSVITDSASVIKFDGSSFLSVPDHADWEFGTNDFTVETWYKASTFNNGGGILGNATGGGWADIGLHFGTDSGGRFQCYVGHNGGTGAYFASSGSSDLNSTQNICDDVWHHLAFVRYGDSIYGYVDGVLEAKDTHAGLNQTNVNTGWFFGKQQTSGGGSNLLPAGSYLDEIRISNVARYTANFTPQTTKFTDDANTKLLIHSDSISESVLEDSSSYSRPITLVGSPTQSTAQKKFGNNSVHLESNNGTSNHIWIPDSDDFDFGTEDFTIETWAYLTAYPAGSNSQSNFFGNATSNSSDAGGQFVFAINGPAYANKLYAATWKRNGSNTSDDFAILGSVPPLNQWNHLAMVRDGTNIRVYVNGVQTGVGDIGSGRLVTNNFASDIHIGKQSYNTGYGYINGYIDEHRISNICRYPSGTTFTPHTSAHVSDANTLFLLSAEGGSQSFTDSSSSPHTISNTGNVKHELLSKVAASAMDFSNATNKYFYITNHSDFHFGTGDWTIEFWAKFNAGSHHHTLWDQNYGSAGGIVIQTTNANPPTMQIKVDNGSLMGTPTGMALDTWHHIAVVRASGQMTYYLNGKADDTQAETGDVNDTSENIWVGFDEMQQSFPVKGSMDEIRVSDVARYTADFTPQTTVFTPDANTKLLLHGEAAAQIPGVPNTGSIGVSRNTTGEYVSTKSTTTSGDSNAKLVMNFDTDATSTITADNYTITNSSGALNTTHKKYGTSSIFFAGGNYIEIAPGSGDLFESTQAGDWTVEWWVKGSANGGTYPCQMVKGPHNVNDQDMRFYTNSNGTITYCDINWIKADGNIRYTNMNGTPAWTGLWQHVAMVRDGNTARFYVDGVQQDTDSNLATTDVVRDKFDTIRFAHSYVGNGTSYFSGYYDDIRFSDICRYPDGTTFTPPSAAHAGYSSTTVQPTTGTLVSTSTTANATVSEVSGIMMYADGTENTSTIGTDLKVHLSSDDGANWTEASSYDNPITFDGTTKLLTLPKTTLTGGTGTAVKMKAEFANQMGASTAANTASVITPHGDAKHSTALAAGAGKIGSSCMKFTGNGSASPASHLSVPHTDDFDFPGDFTVEFWFNTVPSDHSGNGGSLLTRHHAAYTTTQLGFRDSSNGQLMIQAHGHNALFGPTGLHDGNWHHVAWVRSGSGSNNIKCYVDGNQELQYTSTEPWFKVDGVSPIYIGSYGTSEFYGGKMDEVRISDNARYTANFTPSTTAFTSDSNTVVLIHSDTTDGSTAFTDSSSNGYTVTPTNVTHFDTLPPTGGSASISFGGNANTPRLTIPNEGNPLQIAGTDDFTIEGWFLWDGTGTNYARLFNLNFGTTAGSEAINLDYYSPSNTLRAHASTNGGSRNILNSNNTEHGITANTWFHVAMVRSWRADASTSDIKVYVNGQQRNWYFSTGTIGGSETGATFAFGGYGLTGGAVQEFWYGHMDELRISNMARYTSDFTPPRTKFVTDNQTTLLIHADQPNNSVTFTSDEVKSNLIQPIGDVKHSNYIAKVGSSSIRHTSSNGVLNIPDSPDWDFGTNFTVEGWFRFDNFSNKKNIIAHNGGSNSWGNIDFYMQTDNNNIIQIGISNNGNAGVIVDATSQLQVDTWYHIAMIKEGNKLSVAINGTIEASATGSMAPNTNVTNPLWIGSGGAPGNLEGYSDEIRISDVARYTSNFTPSTTAFTSDANTLLLIHSNENSESTTFTDSSSNGHTITPESGNKHIPAEKKFGTSSIYFDGGSQLNIPGRSEFVVSNTDTATIEFWFKLTETTGQYTFMGGDEWTATTERSWMIDAGGSSGGNYIRWTHHSHTVQASWTADTNWHHLAVAIDSGTQKVYLDGTLIVTGNKPLQWGNAAGSKMIIGNGAVSAGGYSQATHGYIDELRWSNVVRYTANFTPSTSAFTADGNTLLLMHGDGSGNLFTDDSYTTGKQTQLHGWAVNY